MLNPASVFERNRVKSKAAERRRIAKIAGIDGIDGIAKIAKIAKI
jgi:hypothetical protein